MAQKTAVEWLIENLIRKNLLKLNGETLKSIGQAKEKEEQQMIDFGKRVADHWGMVDVPRESIEKFLKTE